MSVDVRRVAAIVGLVAASVAWGAAAPSLEIDHIILGASSLDDGIQEFARLTGVTAVRGSQPTAAFANALVNLGDRRFLEILGPANSRLPAISANRLPIQLRPVGWAVHTTDLDGLSTYLRRRSFDVSDLQHGSRTRLDGVQLKWTAVNIRGAGHLAPYLIEWDANVPHPSTYSPTGCRLVSLRLADPEPGRLADLFRALELKQTIDKGDRREMHVTLSCPRGEVTFPQPAP